MIRLGGYEQVRTRFPIQSTCALRAESYALLVDSCLSYFCLMVICVHFRHFFGGKTQTYQLSCSDSVGRGNLLSFFVGMG